MMKGKKEPDAAEYRLRDHDIIIVEDEKTLQEILFELFDSMGNRVFVCDNGEDALLEFKKGGYDVIVTDYGIKGITGIELATRAKEIDERVVTVLLSGWMLSDLKSYKNVVDVFLPKPFKLDDLIKEISKTIQARVK
jgi:two-component SAPR family response regulator